jgi:hypothetical protein
MGLNRHSAKGRGQRSKNFYTMRYALCALFILIPCPPASPERLAMAGRCEAIPNSLKNLFRFSRLGGIEIPIHQIIGLVWLKPSDERR